jgi:zinc protease
MKKPWPRVLTVIAVISSLLPLTSLVFAESATSQKTGMVRTILKNGMLVVLKEDHSSPVSAFQVWVKVGSADERSNEAGISHLIEHMLFKGTDTRRPGEIARAIERYGGHINAYTGHDHTVYHVEIASRYQEQGLSVLADAVQHPRFDEQELAREKEVVIEEIKMRDDDPESALHRALFKTSFQRHPYGRPVIGYADSVRGITRKAIVDYYRQWYCPKNMVFVGVGDFRAAVLLARVAAFFTHSSCPPPVRQRPAEPPQNAFRPLVIQQEVKERYFALGFHIPGVHAEDMYALDLLAACLGQGASSLLSQELRLKRGWVNSISASAFTPRDAGLFMIGGSFQPDNIRQGIAEISRVLARIKGEGITEAELRKARVMVETAFTYERETVEGEAAKLGWFETVMGDATKEQAYLDGIARVRVAKIREVAAKYLRPQNLSLCLVVPRAAGEEVEARSLESWVGGITAISFSNIEAQGIRKRTLENGITVLLKEDHSVPVAGIAVVFLGGVRFEKEQDAGITRFLAKMMTRGTASFDAVQFAREVDSLGATLEAFSGRNSFGVQAKGLSKDFPQLVRLLGEAITTPAFPPDELERVRNEILAAQREERDSMVARTMQLLRETLYKRHPYRLNVLGEEKTVGRIGRRDLIGYYERYAVPQNMVVAIAGDLSWDEAFASIQNALGGMRGGRFSPPSISEEAHGGTMWGMRKREEITPGKEQVHLALGFLGTTLRDHDRFALEVLEAAIGGQGGWFFTELRDKEGLAYVTAFFARADFDPGYLGVYAATSPAKVEQALQGMERIIKEVQEQGISQEELDRAKASLIGNYEIDHQTPLAVASTMAFDERYGLGGDFYRHYARAIEQVTVDDVRHAARKYLTLDASAMVVIRPPLGSEQPSK